MRYICTSIVATLVLAGTSFAATINVPADYTTIQAAIDAAADGDEVVVAPGTYTGTGDEVVNMLGKAITLRASGTPEETIIDGEDTRRGILCNSGETINGTLIEGFTITGGRSGTGAGIYCVQSSPTLLRCTIANNTAHSNYSTGGGITLHTSNPLLTDCRITDNFAGGANSIGGGIYCFQSDPQLLGCEISANLVQNGPGGGIYCADSWPTLENCQVRDNTAPYEGGGIYVANAYTARPALTGTAVCGNSPDQIWGNWSDGGNNLVSLTCPVPQTWTVDDDGPADFDNIQAAVDAASDGDEIVVEAGTYTSTGDNIVDMMGKSVWLHSNDGPETTIIDGEDVRRGIFCANEETAKTLIEGFTIRNCDATEFDYFEDGTLYRLGGGLLIRDASPSVANCVFSNNAADDAGLGFGGGMFVGSYVGICEATFTDCTINGNSCPNSGGGAYVYHASLNVQSCTISNNTAPYGGGLYMDSSNSTTLTDTTVCCNAPSQIDGNWSDSGGNHVADECLDDCNCNLVSDLDDVADGTSFDCDQDLIPDECEPDCDGDGYIDDCDSDPDIDGNGIPDNCEEDCNDNGIPDHFEIKQGWETDCDEDEVLDSCQLADGSATDCDEDGTLDHCQITDDPAMDCDQDGVIDLCAIADGTVEDCNENLIPDSCDIANGGDADGDGYLDECECAEDIAGPDGPGFPDGEVNIDDLLTVIGYWGSDIDTGDVNDDGIVNTDDLLAILAAWGPCP